MAVEKTVAARGADGGIKYIVSPQDGVREYSTGALTHTITPDNNLSNYPSGTDGGSLSEFLSNFDVEE